MTLHRRLILAAAAFSLFALPVASQAQTVMKLASATINDGQHEWQKLFVEALKSKPGGDKIKRAALCCVSPEPTDRHPRA